MSRPWSIFYVFLSLALLVLAFVLSLLYGTRTLSFEAALTLFGYEDADPLETTILTTSRLPRSLIAAGVGSGLGVAGAILQTVTRNLLADPGLLGINSGAAFAVVLTTAVWNSAPPLLVLGSAATFGAAASGVMVFFLAGGARSSHGNALRLILAGAVTAILLGAATQFLFLFEPGAFEASQAWLAGSFADRPQNLISIFLPLLVAFLILGILIAQPMQLLMISEVQGRALGADIAKLRLLALAIAAVICGFAVSLAGPIAFVGLIAPHVTRWLAGPTPLPLFIGSSIFGATFALFADVVSRLAVAPAELPVGLSIAFFGVPFYLVLLRSWRLR